MPPAPDRGRRRRGGSAAPVRPKPAPAALRIPAARVRWWHWTLLALLIAAAYGPVVRADFLNWDDNTHVYENPRVVAPDGLRRSLHDASEPGLYPVLFTTYYLEWRAAGGKPWLFHVDNVVLHAANAALVGMLAAELGMAAIACWLVAALWALHPVHVESVAWITERKNVLYVFFWLVSLLVYLRHSAARPGGRRARVLYGASLLVYALALLSKGAAITLPAAIVLVEWLRGRRLDRRFWLSLTPYVVLGVAGGIGLVRNVGPDIQGPPLGLRLALACRAFWVYLATFLWPHPLVPVYPRWSIRPLGLPEHLSIAGLAAVAIAGTVVRRRLPRLMVVGAGLFATNVFLVLGVVWNSYHQAAFVADRYLYLPGVGLAIVAVAGLGELTTAARLPGRVVTAAAVAWIALLAVATRLQVPVWHDAETFWRHTLSRNPNCALCEYDLANALTKQRRPEEAIPHYREALTVLSRSPDMPPGPVDVHNNLGVALMQTGRLDEAGAEFEATLRLHRGDGDAEFNLGLIASHREDWEAAIAHYWTVLRQERDASRLGRVHHELASALASQGNAEEAIVHHDAAHRLMPDDLDVLEDLVGALLGKQRVGEAVDVLEAGIRRTPDSARLASALAWLRATSADGRWRDGGEAVRLAERARALSGDLDADALDILAAAYAEAGRFTDAVRTAREALDAAGSDPELANEIRSRIAEYEGGRPFRAP